MIANGSHTIAVVPVKSFALAKMRLAAVLNPDQRRGLALAMLCDVLETMAACSLCRTIVVTHDATAAALSKELGVLVLDEGEEDLNAAIGAGARYIDAQTPGSSMLVIPSDIPQIAKSTIESAIASLSVPQTAVLAQARRDGGTNLFGCNPAGALTPSFGPGSFERHVASADTGQLRVTINRDARVAIDLDEPADLQTFLNLRTDTRCDRLLRSWNIATRLPAGTPRPIKAIA